MAINLFKFIGSSAMRHVAGHNATMQEAYFLKSLKKIKKAKHAARQAALADAEKNKKEQE